MKPYWEDDTTALYLGDCREVLPTLGLTADLIVADPPYAETNLAWDRWPNGWLNAVASASTSMWCFGSVRLFGERWPEFQAAGFVLSHDIVWEKHNGASFVNDRFKRVHEIAAHWYRGPWAKVFKTAQTTPDATKRTVRRKQRPTHTGDIGQGAYTSQDGGPRMMRSVLQVRSMHGRAIHPTEKPVGILTPLIEYACPPGGLVVDPFAGSASTLVAARETGRRAIGIEANKEYLERAVRRLSQAPLDFTEITAAGGDG